MNDIKQNKIFTVRVDQTQFDILKNDGRFSGCCITTWDSVEDLEAHIKYLKTKQEDLKQLIKEQLRVKNE